MVQTSKVNATAGVSKAGLAGILMTLGIVFALIPQHYYKYNFLST